MKDKELRNRIKWLRNNGGFKQTDLVEKLNLKISAIQSHEYGQWPNRNNIFKYLEFYRCDEVWLKTGHGVPYPEKPEPSKPSLIYKVEDCPKQVAAPEKEYDLHGGWKPRPEMQDEDHNMLGKAFEIIRSNTIYRPALLANINAFHAAMTTEKKLDKTEKQLDNTMKILEDQADTIRQMGLRIAALEKKNEPAEKDVAAG